MDEDGQGGAAPGARRWLVVGRRVALGLVVLGGALTVLRGLPPVCHDAVAESAVVRVCEPMAVTDPRALLFLLAVGLLLLPELSELELAGVLTVRRRLEEARQDAAELRSDLAQLRLQATSLAQSSASSTNQVNVDVEVRQQETGAALAEADGAGLLGVAGEAGAYAQLAFQAGMAGLPLLLPQDGAEVSLVGYTVGDDGRFEATYVSGVVEGEALGQLTRLVNAVDVPGTAVLTLDEGYAGVSSAVHGEEVIGALAVRVPEGQVPDPGAMEALGAGAEVAAGAYTRLLVDLLGEGHGRGAGARRQEKGQ